MHDHAGGWLLELLPPFIEAVWGASTFGEQSLGTRRWRRVGLGSAWPGSIRVVLDACAELEVLAIEAPYGLDRLLAETLPELTRPIPTLCLGLRGRAAELDTHLEAIERLPVSELRIGDSGLAAWEAPLLVLRRDAAGHLRPTSA